MITKINYVANDGKEFNTAAECLEYEKMMLNNFKRAMVELDAKLWERYYPEQKGQPNPELYQAVDWLRADIEHIMLDFPDSREDILNLIRINKYGKEILKEIALNKIDRNVEIRSDFAAALKSVKSGSDLSSDLCWSLSNKDICKLAKLHKKNKYRKKIETDIEYVVYLAPSLDGKTVEEASLEAGRKLGVGDKEDNTGLLIYVALADREFRMEVGYGLEGVIPDSQAKRIIDCMTSYFKNENYADGLLAAVTKTVEILNDSGEYTISQDENYVVETDTDDDDLLVGMIVVIVFIVVLCVASAFVDGGSGSSSSGHYYSSGYSSSSSSSGSFGGGSFGGGGASGGW